MVLFKNSPLTGEGFVVGWALRNLELVLWLPIEIWWNPVVLTDFPLCHSCGFDQTQDL